MTSHSDKHVVRIIGHAPDEPVLGWSQHWRDFPVGTKFYTSPFKREPLTHGQRLDLLTAFEPHKTAWNAHSILIDMVEAAHGIGDKK